MRLGAYKPPRVCNRYTLLIIWQVISDKMLVWMSQPEGRPVPLRLRYHTIQYSLFFIADSDRSGSSISFSCDGLFLILNIEGTGFHPVWDISYQKPCFLVQILQLRRFNLVPTCKIRPASANLWIRPIILQENDQTLIFFPHASANQQHHN